VGRRSTALTLGRVVGLLVAIFLALALVAPPASAHGRGGSDSRHHPHHPSHSNSQSSHGADHGKPGKSSKPSHELPARPANKSTSRSNEHAKSSDAKRGEQRRPSTADWNAADSAKRTVSTPVPLPTAFTVDVRSSSTDTGPLGGLLGGVTDAAGGVLGGLVGGVGSTVVTAGGALGDALGSLLGTHRHRPKPVPESPPVKRPKPQPSQPVTPTPAAQPPSPIAGQGASHGGEGALRADTQRPGSAAPANSPTTTLRVAPTTAPALQERPTGVGSSSQAPKPVPTQATPPVAAPHLQNASLAGVTLPLLGVLLLFALGVLAVVVTAGYRGRRVH
jgi:hypothetical protein